MEQLTKTQEKILEIVSAEPNGITPAQIKEKLKRAPRTIRYGLERLCKLSLLKRVPNLNKDMRSHLYFAA